MTQRHVGSSEEASSIGETLFVQAKELSRLVDDLISIVGAGELGSPRGELESDGPEIHADALDGDLPPKSMPVAAASVPGGER